MDITPDLTADDDPVQYINGLVTPTCGSSPAVNGTMSRRMAASSSMVELGRRMLAAARSGHTEVVRELISQGAPFTTDWLGTSSLHLAAMKGHAETCAVLLRAGISRDTRTKVERTPLHLASYEGHTQVLQVLLEAGAAVDCRDMLQMTPLHWAVERGHVSAAAVLLQRGADAGLVSKFLQSPRSLAEDRGLQAMLSLMDDAERRQAPEHIEVMEPEDDLFENIETDKTSEPWEKEETIQQSTKYQQEECAGEEAAALLRSHGITLLPTDDGSTVLNALQSGRTVVLSDAGKLMLKESEAPKDKGFTLLNRTVSKPLKMVSLPTVTRPGAVRKVVNPSDLKIKYMQMPKNAKIISDVKVNLSGMPGTPLKVSAITPTPAKPLVKQVVPLSELSALTHMVRAKSKPRGNTVKILVNKSNFGKLIAAADKANALQNTLEQVQAIEKQDSSYTPVAESDNVVRVPEQFLRSADPEYLRAQLLAAHATLSRVQAELRAVRAARRDADS